MSHPRTRVAWPAICALVFILFVGLSPCRADPRAIHLDTSPAERRVALVVGESAYMYTEALANPKNDAADVARALEDIGFEVTHVIDARKPELEHEIERFAREATTANAAIFYYAGHGMQYNGQNYLMPIEARLKDDLSLRFEMLAVDAVKEALQRSPGIKIMVLDACRDNPLAEQMVREVSGSASAARLVQGHAPLGNTPGMIVAYATQADGVAADGTGRNSPFSSAFLKEIQQPGVEVGMMFRRVAGDVYAATHGAQSPELSISLTAEYYLNQKETDQAVWVRVRESNDAAEIREFLRRYPGSFYARDAGALLELLERVARDQSKGETEDKRGQTTHPAADPSPEAAAGSRRDNNEGVQVEPSKVALAGPARPSDSAQPNRMDPPELIVRIEAELRRIGCYAGADADWNAPPIRASLSRFAQYGELRTTPTIPDDGLLDRLQRQRARVCPPE